MNTFSKINADLKQYGLQLEQAIARQWYITNEGEYGRGQIHGYFKYNRGTDIAETLLVYKTSGHKELLLTLNTTIWDCVLTGGTD
ncbi:hypothetical protein SBP1_gp086 [Vibrio virus vB_VspP_SBP1]|uniref:Uncharacterized protein n=1 Tax=Vibrio virus vB_VspP_SBP1 TaxID=2500581 RepID=A0A3T0IIN2_9CAUD|nr:hypothetical protein KNU36_gp043 [Vibrio virus vB_VspP_SBP1]AZU99678.1 hypothetical protein SBP1_gp086 [Vibrio virus vB_VspP_SBP1]